MMPVTVSHLLQRLTRSMSNEIISMCSQTEGIIVSDVSTQIEKNTDRKLALSPKRYDPWPLD